MTGQPSACLLHADVHVMEQPCWAATLDWMFANQDIPEDERRAAYQAAVERRILDGLTDIQPPPTTHNAGPSIAECAAADRVWPLQKRGE
jgi:hypothetical protein